MLRIYVTYTIPDARAKSKEKYFQSLGLKSKIGAVCVVDSYIIDAKVDAKGLQKARELLANPLMQECQIVSGVKDKGLKIKDNFDYAIEIGFLPGVTDNVGSTAKETLIDGAKIKFKPGQNVYSSQVFFISFKTPTPSPRSAGYSPSARGRSSADVQKIANSLHNPLIQRASIKSYSNFKKDGGMDLIVPKVKLSASNKVTLVDLNVGDDELVRLGKLGIPDSVIASAAEAILSKEKIASSDALLAMTPRRGPLALGLVELKTIRNYFQKIGRKPTDVEIETLAQTWSEHCKHTIFADPIDELEKGIYKTYIKGATEKIRKQKGSKDFCVSVFTDNAGGISFDKDWIISHKVETHNTPSALDPFGGAITGIVGVNRDALGFGLGSKPVANFYGFCLASPDNKTELFRGPELKNPMLSARRIMDGVIAGINSGGNQSGIPTPLGFLYFDDKFRGKPLVFAGTVGLIPKKIGSRKGWEKKAKPGDLIVNIGGRVGADGIHGATFASEGLDTHSPATAVQIGDPITQKKFSDAISKEARAQNLYNSITDCGAGGLSSAVGEMAGQAGDPSGSSRAKSRGGCEVNLDKVLLKYPGMAPWQIWISESQERMVLAVPKGKWKKFEKLMKSRGVEATIIGKFTNSGKCIVKYGSKTVLDMDMNFLHDGRPVKQQHTQAPIPSGVIPRSAADEESLKFDSKLSLRDPLRLRSGLRLEQAALGMTPKKIKTSILSLLSNPNIASTAFVSTQYDHEVQSGSVLKPLQGRGLVNSEAAVTRPVLTSQKSLVLASGLYPSYSEINPYNMAAASIDSAIRAAVAAGANVDYLALLDNFCWCSPEDPGRLWQLKEAARACYDYAVAFGTPFISGKDSMYNDFKGFNEKGDPLKISIPPTLLISAIGVIPDITKTVSLDAKLPGDLLYILGETNNEMGGSEYESSMMEKSQNVVQAPGLPAPSVNASKNLSLYRALYKAIQQNLIASSITVNRGGLSIALMKKLIGGNLGAEVNIKNLPGNWESTNQALFSESQGRILVSVAPQNVSNFEKIISGQAFGKLGKIIAQPTITITNNNKPVADFKLTDAEKAYKSTFKNY